MLTGRLASGRPFDVLHASVFDTALRETTSKFGADLAKSESAVRCHRAITEPLQKALSSSDEIRSIFSGEESERGVLEVVQIGKVAFPMIVRELKHGMTAIELYPAMKPSQVNTRAAAQKGVAGLYGEKKKDLDSLAVIRGHGPTTDLAINGKVIRDVSYAWALFEVAAHALRRATTVEAPTTKRVFDPVLEQDVTVQIEKTPGARAVGALMNGAFDATPAAGPALAHELCGVGEYRGRTVAVTARRAMGEGVRVYVETDAGWRSLPIPNDTAWPVGGVTVVQAGDRLHLFGGVDTDGDVLPSHFSVDLNRLDPEDDDAVRRHRDLAEPSAWAAAVSDGRDVFLGGGVAGFMVKAGERRERDKIKNQAFALVRDGTQATRAPAPGDLTRSYALSHGGCLFFAPGDSRDGKVRIYDNTRAGAWMTLPALPADVGLGQLFVDRTKLYYAGGFAQGGEPHTGIYAIDLANPRATWTKVGDSAYAAGLARVVVKNGSIQSLMVTPGGHSAVFTAKGDA